jgi:hypothetical protein
MKLTIKPSEVTITFSPNDYFLVNCKDEMLGDYALHYRIDRSEKGKDDDVGVEVLYLNENEAKTFRKAGFSEIMM